MKARVEKGRIRVTLGSDLDDDAVVKIHEQIASSIGSAKAMASETPFGIAREISCALSVHNFRKLKALGCSLAEDPLTRQTVARMRADQDRYEFSSQRGALAKAGKLDVPGYQFKKPPWAHQLLTFQFLHAVENPALFGEPGVGKTFCVSTFADSLVKAGEPVVLLVVCPVNLIKHVWIADVATFTDLTAVGLREPTIMRVMASDYDEPGFTSDRVARTQLRAERARDPAFIKLAKLRATRRHNKLLQERFAQTAHVYVINPEGLRTDIKEKRVLALCKRLRGEGKKIYLVIDESSKLKSRTSRTYRSLKKIREQCERCIIMTGTPSPNGLDDLWAQFSVLDDGATLQPSFIDYRAETSTEFPLKGVTYVKNGQTFNVTKWHPKPGAAMQVYRTIEPRMIRFRTEDCIDLPPVRFLIRDVEMNEEQSSAYADMEDRLFLEIEGESVTAKVAAGKLMKLREITGGFIITDTGEEKSLGKDSPKMLELDTLLEQCIADKLGDTGPPSKALIWANYQWECHTLVERYRSRYGARGLFGGISIEQKDKAIARFRSDPSARVLVCHPASVGHGLTLTEANYAFYYSLSYNYEEFYQSFRRNSRPGQKRNTTYYSLVCPGTIDEELIDAIRSKKNLSDIITDGRFSREEILGRRETRATSQITIDWPVPDLSDEAGEHGAPGENLPPADGGMPGDQLDLG